MSTPIVSSTTIEHVAETPGSRIRERRKEIPRFRDDQKALAAEVGVQRERVSLWENDKQRPGGENLVKLARALNVTPGWILAGDAAEGAVVIQLPPGQPGLSGYPTGGDSSSGVREEGVGYGKELPDPDPSGSPAEQLLHMLGVRAGLRRVARELTDKDLIAVAYTIARADKWPVEELRKLDAWRDAILEQRRTGAE